jgi:hypothetical protein
MLYPFVAAVQLWAFRSSLSTPGDEGHHHTRGFLGAACSGPRRGQDVAVVTTSWPSLRPTGFHLDDGGV